MPRVLCRCSATCIGRGPRCLERVEQRVDRGRGGHAGRVGEREGVHPDVRQPTGERDDGSRVDATLVRATERGGEDRLYRCPGRGGTRHDAFDLVDRVVDGHLQVAAVVGLAHAHHDLELVRAGVDRQVRAAHVRNQHPIADAVASGDGGEHLVGASHRGDGVGAHERAHLDGAQARLGERVDELDARTRRDRLLVLEPISGTDLAHLAGGRVARRGHPRTTPSSGRRGESHGPRSAWPVPFGP